MRDLITEKLSRIEALEDGWDGYGDRAISKTALDFYRTVFAVIDDRYLREVEPVPHNGGLHLEWDVGDWAYSAAIDHDGTLWLFRLAPDDADDTEQEIKNPTAADLITFIAAHAISKVDG